MVVGDDEAVGAYGEAAAMEGAGAGVPVEAADLDDGVPRGVEPDAVTVDALARLQLAARRRRCRILLRNASVELKELVRFMGLEDVLPER